MRTPAALWLVTGGIVAGELATAVVAPVASAVAGVALAGVACGCARSLRAGALVAFGLALGLVRMRGVALPALPPDHVGRLPLRPPKRIGRAPLASASNPALASRPSRR